MFDNLLSHFPLSLRFMLLSALAFSLMTACVKLVSTYHIPVFEIVAARGLISLIISYADIKRKKLSPWGNNKKLLIARGAVGSIALICVYYAVITLPLAEATLLQYTYPVFTALLAFIFLKEKIQRATICCIILSLAGLIVMVMPNLSATTETTLPWFSVFVALFGASGSAIAYVIVKRLSNKEDSSVIIFYFPLISLPVALILLGSDFVMPNVEAALLLLFIGIFTQVGQVGLTKAMQSEIASKVSAFSYIQVVFSMLFGFIIFSEVPSIWTLSGGALIIIGALINVLASKQH